MTNHLPPAAHCACPRPVPSARARVYCFHDAGGAPDMFAPFVAPLAEAHIELHTIAHTRVGEPSADTARRYLAQASEYIGESTSLPYALLGHSLGGRFAWCVARELQATAPPSWVFVSASSLHLLRNPAGEVDCGRVLGIAFGDLLEAMDDVASTQERMAWDCKLLDCTPEPTPGEVSVPMVMLRPTDDALVSDADAQGWRARAGGPFTLVPVASDHLYVYRAGPRKLLVDEVVRRLSG